MNHERQMEVSKELLRGAFPDMQFTDVLTSAAYGMAIDAAPYANMMAEGTTELSYDSLVDRLKDIERKAGNTKTLRAAGVVMMDIDLLRYNEELCHEQDWQRPYVKTLYGMLKKSLVVILALMTLCVPTQAQRSRETQGEDKELLGKAVEYYIGGKYHETILAFEKLRKGYKLTPRFQAYLGFSYYKEGDYKCAVECLREAIPTLAAFSPKERSAYIYACAESLFQLEKYEEAIKYYDMLLPLTEGNDKGDVLFHKAFSLYIYKGMEMAANDSVKVKSIAPYVVSSYQMFSDALTLYRENVGAATPLQSARLRQCETMLKGFERSLMQYTQKMDTLLRK